MEQRLNCGTLVTMRTKNEINNNKASKAIKLCKPFESEDAFDRTNCLKSVPRGRFKLAAF